MRLNTSRPLYSVFLAALFMPMTSLFAAVQLSAITFASEPKEFYLPLTEATTGLRWGFKTANGGGISELNGQRFDSTSLRKLPDGTPLVGTATLAQAGALVKIAADGRSAVVSHRTNTFSLVACEKRVIINLKTQTLTAWQGTRQVMQSRISSGRGGSTPVGQFRAGPYKAKSHYSSRYHNAPMPWSVQINGHVFVHGFTSVPNYPASHGCIRLPLTGSNPARFFFEWVDIGTPVSVARQ